MVKIAYFTAISHSELCYIDKNGKRSRLWDVVTFFYFLLKIAQNRVKSSSSVMRGVKGMIERGSKWPNLP